MNARKNVRGLEILEILIKYKVKLTRSKNYSSVVNNHQLAMHINYFRYLKTNKGRKFNSEDSIVRNSTTASKIPNFRPTYS